MVMEPWTMDMELFSIEKPSMADLSEPYLYIHRQIRTGSMYTRMILRVED